MRGKDGEGCRCSSARNPPCRQEKKAPCSEPSEPVHSTRYDASGNPDVQRPYRFRRVETSHDRNGDYRPVEEGLAQCMDPQGAAAASQSTPDRGPRLHLTLCTA